MELDGGSGEDGQGENNVAVGKTFENVTGIVIGTWTVLSPPKCPSMLAEIGIYIGVTRLE